MTAASAAFGPLIDAAAQPAKQGFNPSILIFVIIGAAFYFLIYRPQQRKQKAARAQGNSFEVGDEVVTAGGIVGHVLDITDDRVTLETSVGASFVVLRPYVLRKLEPVVPPSDVVDGPDDDHQPEPPPAPPALADASSQDSSSKDSPSPKDNPSKEVPDATGPTTPPPADDPDGHDASGADGPPII
jgi:preprotein translocase subunit YajC